jgi:hypothetical protein
MRPEHYLVEVAPGLYQCSHCGYGPSQQGHRPFWAISSVDRSDDGSIDAINVRFDEKLDCYVMTGVGWRVTESGYKIPLSFIEGGAAILSTPQEIEDAPCPVVIRAKGKWAFPPAKPALRPMMCESALGPKEISLSASHRGKS